MTYRTAVIRVTVYGLIVFFMLVATFLEFRA